MVITEIEHVVLAVVGESDGRWDTRGLDFEYYRRSQVVPEPSLLGVLRDLERRGLVAEVPIPGGIGPGWRLTAAGVEVLDQHDDD